MQHTFFLVDCVQYQGHIIAEIPPLPAQFLMFLFPVRGNPDDSDVSKVFVKITPFMPVNRKRVTSSESAGLREG